MNTDKLDLQTPDMVNENFDKLAALFPNCVTESAEGKAIDFDLLKQELNHAVIEGNRERYRLEWPGKREAIVAANLPTTKTLRPVREDSVDFDNTENLYIEGDNLEVLKLLQESYFGKVKMIYIDPPYNTGNDFVYRDNFTVDKETELFESGQIDEYNQRLVANPETSGRYHSDWLSMMYPRLKLARNLLTDDGVIFISIDDNEVHNLRKVCDEVFGEGNFVAEIIWKKKAGGANDSIDIATEHEYIICYKRKYNGIKKISLSEERIKEYKFSDEKEKTHGKYTTKNLNDKSLQDSKGLHFDIVCPDGSVLYGKDNQWKCNEDTFNKRLADNRILFVKKTTGGWSCNYKIYLNEEKGELKYDKEGNILTKGKNLSSLINNTLNRDGNDEIKSLFDSYPFSYPKPSKLIKQLIECSTGKESIILDFFSGSATTAHAVMQLNTEDDGSRKYVMVQLPEQTDEKSEAYKEGYKNICEIGKERIRRAAKKVKEEKRAKVEKEGVFANFKDTQDYGFRVYRLDNSNMQDVYYRPQDYKQDALDMFADNIKPDRSADDLLAQVMLDWGLPLSYKIEQATINGKQVFKVAQDSLFACFDKGIDENFAKEIAKEKPLRIVFRDNGFANDTAKINVQQLLKQISPETEMKVI
jgi:Adenine specific DNA methylase Mod